MEKKEFYLIYICVIIGVFILLDFLVDIYLIDPITIIIIAVSINVATGIWLIINPSLFKKHAIFVSFSLIFIIFPWLLLIKLMYENQGLISQVLHNYVYFFIFLCFIPVIILDNYLFTKGKRDKSQVKISKTIENNLYYGIFILIVILDYLLIWIIYYNIFSPLEIILFIVIINLLALFSIGITFSFFKKNMIFSIYSFIFLIFPWFLCLGLVNQKELLFSYIKSGLLFYLFLLLLIPIPIINIIQYMIYGRKLKEFD